MGVPASRSHSGQFVYINAPTPRMDPRATLAPGMIELDPTFLPVSCERIKQHLYRELGAGSIWQSKIFLELHSAALDQPGVVLACDRYSNTWQYRVSLPAPVDRVMFVRSIVQVLLVEIANRGNPSPISVEIPTWLIEGFTRQILASRQAEVILAPPTTVRDGVLFTPTLLTQREAPLKAVHETLRTAQPLSFEALNWPGPEHLTGRGAEVYGACSHLFLSRLQQLPRGRERLRKMVELLPARHNWQFALFDAFAPHFEKMLDVEKWWSLQVVHFTGRELGQWWPVDESCGKIREALQVPVKIHESATGLPTQGQVTLQTALRQWKTEDQRRLIQQKARELEMLRLRVAPELSPLVEDYRLILKAWLDDNTRGMVVLGLGRRAAQARAAAYTAHQLDILDQRLREMTPQQ
jgi:hypothetical protein